MCFKHIYTDIFVWLLAYLLFFCGGGGGGGGAAIRHLLFIPVYHNRPTQICNVIHSLQASKPAPSPSPTTCLRDHRLFQWTIYILIHTVSCPEPVFVNVGAQESIPLTYVDKAGRYDKGCLTGSQVRKRFLGSLKGLQIRALTKLHRLTNLIPFFGKMRFF